MAEKKLPLLEELTISTLWRRTEHVVSILFWMTKHLPAFAHPKIPPTNRPARKYVSVSWLWRCLRNNAMSPLKWKLRPTMAEFRSFRG